MKKIIMIVAGLCLVLIIAFVLYYIYPKKINHDVVGIKYQLGADHQDFAKLVTIQVKGTLQNSLTGTKTFKGTIGIEGEDIPTPEEQKQLAITFDNRNLGILMHPNPPNYKPPYLSFGAIYINDDFSQFSINISVKDELNPGYRHWNSGDGFIISAPAQNRSQALKVSNEVMKPSIQGYTLE